MEKAYRDDSSVPVKPATTISKAYKWIIPVGIIAFLMLCVLAGKLLPPKGIAGADSYERMPVDKAAIKIANEEFIAGEAMATFDENTKVLVIQPCANFMDYDGIYLATKYVMKKLHTLDVNSITFQFIGGVKDVYGNIKNQVILKYTFPRALIDKIDWENFDRKNIPIVCEDYWSK